MEKVKAIDYIAANAPDPEGEGRYAVRDMDASGTVRFFGYTDNEVVAILYAAGGFAVTDDQTGDRLNWLGRGL